MTVYVRTSENEGLAFDADDWQTSVDSEGDLWIGMSEVGVAQFSPGAWSFVYEIKDLEPEGVEAELVPREWASLLDVPFGVEVVDRDGDRYWSEYGEWFIDRVGGRLVVGDEETYYAPYTEILEDK